MTNKPHPDTPYTLRAPSCVALSAACALLSACEPVEIDSVMYQGDANPLVTGVQDMAPPPREWFTEADQAPPPATVAGVGAPTPAGVTAGGLDGGGEGGALAGTRGGEEPPPTPSVPEIETSVRLSQGTLALDTNLPPFAAGCDPSALLGLSCDDRDEDGLVDQWEEALLEGLRPALRFHPDEPLLSAGGGPIIQLGRVSVRTTSPLEVSLNIVTLLPNSEALCLIAPGSTGDLEHTIIKVTQQGTGSFAVTGARLPPTRLISASRYFDRPERVITPDGGDAPRWVVYSLKKQHTLFESEAACTEATTIVCDSNCPSEAPAQLGASDRLPPITHVGEPARPLINELDALGYPGERAWGEEEFCGGVRVDAFERCAGQSIRALLTTFFEA